MKKFKSLLVFGLFVFNFSAQADTLENEWGSKRPLTQNHCNMVIKEIYKDVAKEDMTKTDENAIKDLKDVCQIGLKNKALCENYDEYVVAYLIYGMHP